MKIFFSLLVDLLRRFLPPICLLFNLFSIMPLECQSDHNSPHYGIKCSLQPDIKSPLPRAFAQPHLLTLLYFVSLAIPNFSYISKHVAFNDFLPLPKCLLRVPNLPEEHLIHQDQVQCLLCGAFFENPTLLPLLYSHSTQYSSLSLQVACRIAKVCLYVCVSYQTGRTSRLIHVVSPGFRAQYLQHRN